MKKLLLIFLSSSFLICCQQHKQTDNQNEKTDSSSSKDLSLAALGLPNTDGKKMIGDFVNKKNNKLKFKDIIWATFDKTAMLVLYNDSHVLSVKFFVGVFSETDPDVKKKDAPVIILQVKRDDIPIPQKTGVTTGFLYYTGDSYCPPPNDSSCGAVEQ